MKVGRVSEIDALQNEQGQHYFREDCSIDMSKCGDSYVGQLASRHLFQKGNPFLYWYEGEKEVTEDCYGSKPRPVPIDKVVKALREDVKVLDHGDNDRPYRRFEWALSLLEAIERRDGGEKKEFCVIFEGH